MTLSSSNHDRTCLFFVVVIFVCLITACVISSSQRYPHTDQADQARYKALEDKISHLQLIMLEKDAQINALQDRLNVQQNILDDAVMEVVRAKAKLRSVESKAEAASNMAEAEIALEALKMRVTKQDENTAVLKAEQLLQLSAGEFNKENYGGSLYLTSQAKAHIRAGQLRCRGQDNGPTLNGELLFAEPLPLQVLRKSNLRDGPSLNSKVITTLDQNTLVIGYSYKDKWIRVKCEDGAKGWIFRSLVGDR
ncbi:MAG: SH3 domain-containing protein [bacterium]